MSDDFELARGRVLHFNESSWDALQDALARRGLALMAEHVAEQRVKDVVVLDLNGHSPGVLADQLAREGFADIADQIEAQTKPPRIPEPRLWGVVDAYIMGDRSPQANYHWVHVADDQWEAIGSSQAPRRWNELIDPTLVREGVSS